MCVDIAAPIDVCDALLDQESLYGHGGLHIRHYNNIIILTVSGVSDPDHSVVLIVINHCIARIAETDHKALGVFSDVIVNDRDNDPHLSAVNGEH